MFRIHEAGERFAAESDHVPQFEQGKAADAHGGMIRQMVCIGQMPVQGFPQGRECPAIEADEQLLGVRRGEDLIKEHLQGGIGHGVEAEGRLAHFPDTFAQGCGVLRAQMGMEAEPHLEFVERFGGEACRENLVQPLEGVVKPLQTGDAILHGQAGFHGGAHWADPRQ